jgi:hypothetical protein
MSRRPARFTEAELKRAVKVAMAQGGKVVIEIPSDPLSPIRVTSEPIKPLNDNAPKRRIAL